MNQWSDATQAELLDPTEKELDIAFQDGFQKGSAGMNLSYCPQAFYLQPLLKKRWTEGWKTGQQAAGIEKKKPFLPIFGAVILFAIVVLSFYFYPTMETHPIFNSWNQEASTDSETASSNSQTETVSSDSQTESSSIDTETGTETASNETPMIAGEGITEIDKVDSTDSLESSIEPTSTEPEVADFGNDATPVAQAPELSKEPTSLTEPTPNNATTPENEVTNANNQTDDTVRPQKNKPRLTQVRFTRSVIDRVPDEPLSRVDAPGPVYYFTNVRFYKDHTITHFWYLNNQLLTKKSFDIKGNRWRVFSLHTIPKNTNGTIRVVVYASNSEQFISEQFIEVDTTQSQDTALN